MVVVDVCLLCVVARCFALLCIVLRCVVVVGGDVVAL